MNDAITKQLADALRRARGTLAWYSVNAEGNSPERPDEDDTEIVAAADAALAAYDAEAEEPAVVIRWSSADMPGRTRKQRRAQLEAIAADLEDRCISVGSEFIEDSFD